MDSLVCGIDVGSTNVKVILVDRSARSVWTKAIPVPRSMQGGLPATDASALVATLEGLVIEGWRATGAATPLRAISITGVGEDGVPVSDDLRPLDLAIPWFDKRADNESERLRDFAGESSRAGVSIDSSRTAAKWLWLRENRPEVMRDARLWLTLTDYAAAWWSRTPFISETLATRTACYDVFSRTWMPAMLGACGAPPLPPVLAAGTVVGTVAAGPLLESGAASGNTLIVAGGHDHPIAASAVRRLNGQALVDSLGTANLMYTEIESVEPRTDPFVAFSVPALGTPGVACLGVYEFSAALEPFRARDAGVALRSFLAGGRLPGKPSEAGDIAEALKRGLVPTINPVPYGDAVQLRATLESACLYARRMLEAIRDTGSSATPIYAVGGWARSDALLQLRASVFGEAVASVEESELTALGAALIARDAIESSETRLPFQRHVRFIQPLAEWEEIYEQYYPEFRERLDRFKEKRTA
ncbi:carbohydrate kinase [Caballeronia mineralivorans PML1(12)]|uniref:Carbohydrate kinase n=1 Tax=Caballeronia mineralivorans PML1(12) TaxID=908627 RepID=A0A0J1CWQ7_9BURK|nr:FGGY family carbohydrate kinase [Caballeronia mineralivorans]KLU25009.1 carbohydrate kinase [Caballeronia mineralivorans PML1(12)]